jgi:hypothetical protein
MQIYYDTQLLDTSNLRWFVIRPDHSASQMALISGPFVSVEDASSDEDAVYLQGTRVLKEYIQKNNLAILNGNHRLQALLQLEEEKEQRPVYDMTTEELEKYEDEAVDPVYDEEGNLVPVEFADQFLAHNPTVQREDTK